MRNGFLLGLVCGVAIGAFVAPIVYKEIIDNSKFPIGDIIVGSLRPVEIEKWPSSTQALKAMQIHLQWPNTTDLSTSSANVDDCVTLSNGSFGCDITLNLAWSDKPSKVSARFQDNNGQWSVIDIQRNRKSSDN